jgi:hypothetical protein
MEVQDVFADIATPPTSEDEDPEAPLLHPPTTPHILQRLHDMLAAVSTPSRGTSYSDLYSNSQYVRNVTKKLKKMKKRAKQVDFESVYMDELFWIHLNRIERTYPDDGGRAFLNHLVALESHLTTQYDMDSGSESESVDESEPEPEDRPEDRLDGNDHQGQGGAQMLAV